MTEKSKGFWAVILTPSRILKALLGLLIIAGLLWAVLYFRESTKIIPEELINTAVNNTLDAKTYRFQTKSTITLNGEEKVFSNLTGQRANPNTFHVTGTMLDTPVDVIQIDNTTYRLDHMTDKWMVTENNTIMKESLLMTELNPLSNFYFKELMSAAYLGKEKAKQGKVYKLECVPKIQNKWLENYFKDLKYILWITKKEKMITKATVSAISKENENGSLTVEVEFFDYHKPVEIKPPVQNKE